MKWTFHNEAVFSLFFFFIHATNFSGNKSTSSIADEIVFSFLFPSLDSLFYGKRKHYMHTSFCSIFLFAPRSCLLLLYLFRFSKRILVVNCVFWLWPLSSSDRSIHKCLLYQQCIERYHMAGTIALHLCQEFRNLNMNMKRSFNHGFYLYVFFVNLYWSGSTFSYRIHLPWPLWLRHGLASLVPSHL